MTEIRERYEHKIAVCTCEEVQNYRLATCTHQSLLDRTANTQSLRPLKEAFSSDSHVLTRIRSIVLSAHPVAYQQPHSRSRSSGRQLPPHEISVSNTSIREWRSKHVLKGLHTASAWPACSSIRYALIRKVPPRPASIAYLTPHAHNNLWTRALPKHITPHSPATDDAAQSL